MLIDFITFKNNRKTNKLVIVNNTFFYTNFNQSIYLPSYISEAIAPKVGINKLKLEVYISKPDDDVAGYPSHIADPDSQPELVDKDALLTPLIRVS